MAAIKEPLASAEQSPAKPQSYIWSFPGAPVRIHLDLAVVQGLKPRFRGKDGGTQCGLLLGHADGITTVVSGFQPLAAANAPEIKLALAALGAAPGRPQAVGYYRAQRQEGLCLDQKDLALAEAFFRHPHNVILLVHPCDADPANATFFFWDAGRLNGDFPFLEFPFDSNLLAAAEQHRVDAAQRRAFEMPAVPAPAAAKSRPRAFPKRLVWIAAVVLLAAGAVIGVRFLPERFRWSPSLPAFSSASGAGAAAPNAPRPSMGLHAERQNGDLKLTWNRDAVIVSNATSGVLSIIDGESRRTIPLQSAQVRGGSILYTPVSDQVQMELAVSTPADNIAESVLVLLPKTGPPQTLAARPPVRIAPPPAPAPAPAEETASRFQQAKPFSPPPGPSRTPAPAIPISEPPSVAANSADRTATTPLWSRIDTLQPPPIVASAPAPKAPAPRPAPPDAAPYHPPEPVREVRPTFPATLKTLVNKPTTIEIVVSIDETGKVVKAEPKPQPGVNQMLVAASLAAAREWRFRPARQGDTPVRSEMLVRFNFSAPQ